MMQAPDKNQDLFLKRVLQPPRYPFEKNGVLYRPSGGELWREFILRLNVFADRRNWISVVSYSVPIFLQLVFFLYLFRYFSWASFSFGILYAFVWLPITGTAIYHRYGAHRAFVLKNKFLIFLVRNLMLKIVLEEIFIVSHYLHHAIPDEPGDPYNPRAGYWYSFLADVNHQPVAKDLSESEYDRLCKLLAHTGVVANSYLQYQRWGSVVHPGLTITHIIVNWLSWFAIFYWLGGGLSLPLAIFGCSSIWAWRIRSINYDVHGRGETRHRDGIDFHRRDNSINITLPGILGGEWHNNHHMYPSGIRAGFLPHQIDTPYLFIKTLIVLGAVRSYRDDTARFRERVRTDLWD